MTDPMDGRITNSFDRARAVLAASMLTSTRYDLEATAERLYSGDKSATVQAVAQLIHKEGTPK